MRYVSRAQTVRKTQSLRHCAMSANYMKGRVKEFAKPFAH
jgi:hypothetical protein